MFNWSLKKMFSEINFVTRTHVLFCDYFFLVKFQHTAVVFGGESMAASIKFCLFVCFLNLALSPLSNHFEIPNQLLIVFVCDYYTLFNFWIAWFVYQTIHVHIRKSEPLWYTHMTNWDDTSFLLNCAVMLRAGTSRA